MKRVRFIIFGIILGIIISYLVYYISNQIYIFEDFEFKTLDLRFRLRGNIHPSKSEDAVFEDIIIVDIDEKSLKKLGRFYDWPRSYHAKAIDYINKGAPKAIGFDIIFAEEDKEKTQDNLLALSTKRANNIVHSLVLSPKGESEKERERENLYKSYSYPLEKDIVESLEDNKAISLPIKSIIKSSRSLGYVSIIPDYDGILRRTHLIKRYKDRVYPSFALELARIAMGVEREDIEVVLGRYIKLKNIKIPIDKKGRMLINYVGPAFSYRYISYWWVLKKRVPYEIFKDKIVLFGTSAPGLMDLRSTPFSPAYPGVEVHANIIHNIQNRNSLISITQRTNIILILSLGVLIGFFSSFLRLFKSIFFLFTVIISYLIVTLYYFEGLNIWLPVVQPLMAILASYLVVWIYRYGFEEREKRKIKKIFEKYVPSQVVREILNDPQKLKLGGEKKEITILFTDIRGFTSISEEIMPEEAVSLLNKYFTSMSKIIFKYGGTLDKFMGDGIMAFYGAPVYSFDHAKKAILTSLEMRKELEKLNQEWIKEGKSSLDMGIGINTGDAVVGNIGSEDRMEYTAIGDNVNLCARLQALSKGGQIIISESTYQKVKDWVEVSKLEPVKIKGKKKPVQIYEIKRLRTNQDI